MLFIEAAATAGAGGGEQFAAVSGLSSGGFGVIFTGPHISVK